VLLVRSGELSRASELWRRAFARNADITELGMNLAAARCLAGDRAGAETVLRTVLSYSPDHRQGRLELRTMACPPR